MGLGIFSFVLYEVSWFPGRDVVGALLSRIFGADLAAVLFGNLGPAWCLIGGIFALGYLIAFRKKTIAVVQHSLELVLCFLILISFPAY